MSFFKKKQKKTICVHHESLSRKKSNTLKFEADNSDSEFSNLELYLFQTPRTAQKDRVMEYHTICFKVLFEFFFFLTQTNFYFSPTTCFENC